MRVLWLSPSDMTTEPVIEGLTGHVVEIHRYDVNGLPVDRGMLDAADRFRPNVILYIGQNNAPFCAGIDTFHRLRKVAKTALICFDASDATWLPYVEQYARDDAFDLMVNIDGNPNWPCRAGDLTLLTPTAAHFYQRFTALAERPIGFGFAGGYSSPSRRDIVEHCRRAADLVIPRRNERYGTYEHYSAFLRKCQILLNVPYSGSDNSHQVKGRVLEAGWAGCVLLEHEKSGAKDWFNPGIDYAVYHDAEDAVARVQELQADPEWMQRLAHNLATRVRQEHHPDIFWGKVWGALGL